MALSWFQVLVEGDLAAADAALHGDAMVLRVSRAYASFVEAGPPELSALSVIVEAQSGVAAEGITLDKLPGDDWNVTAKPLPHASR